MKLPREVNDEDLARRLGRVGYRPPAREVANSA